MGETYQLKSSQPIPRESPLPQLSISPKISSIISEARTALNTHVILSSLSKSITQSKESSSERKKNKMVINNESNDSHRMENKSNGKYTGNNIWGKRGSTGDNGNRNRNILPPVSFNKRITGLEVESHKHNYHNLKIALKERHNRDNSPFSNKNIKSVNIYIYIYS